jgi:hypothetical protein
VLDLDPFEWVNLFTIPIKYPVNPPVPTPASFELLEDDFYLLLEDGGRLQIN